LAKVARKRSVSRFSAAGDRASRFSRFGDGAKKFGGGSLALQKRE
jgi:hypothetical protein